MNTIMMGELLDEVASSDIDSTLKLAEILFKQKDYRLARIFYQIAQQQGIEQATDRLCEIESILKREEILLEQIQQKEHKETVLIKTSEGISDELLDKVASGNLDATLELAEELFKRGQYHLARIFFLMAKQDNQQIEEQAKERLGEIELILAHTDLEYKTMQTID